MKNKYITISCSSPDLLPLSELAPFNERFKARNSSDIKKLANCIVENGFHCPFFVWKNDGKNRILDGNGRYLALNYLQDKGYTIPDLPIVFIHAENEREARHKVLELNNVNGEFSLEQFLDYSKELNIEYSQIHIPGLVFSESCNQETPKNDKSPKCDQKSKSDTSSVRVTVCPHCGAEVSISAGKRDGSNG